jgi:hypothetical protein
LRRRLEEVAQSEVKTATVRAHTREYEVALYPASVVFDLAFEFDLGLAKQMGSAGAAVYLYGLAGYQVKPQVPDETNLAEWLKARAEGKVNRLSLTDQIKVFIQYASEADQISPNKSNSAPQFRSKLGLFFCQRINTYAYTALGSAAICDRSTLASLDRVTNPVPYFLITSKVAVPLLLKAVPAAVPSPIPETVPAAPIVGSLLVTPEYDVRCPTKALKAPVD